MGPPLEERDERWFTRVYTSHYADIVSYGRRRLADADAATELAQEVFVVAWRRRAEVPAGVLPWLYGVARRLLANRWRAARAVPDVRPMTEADGLRDAESSGPEMAATMADIRTALGSLSERDQEILRLVGWEELTVSEAAQVLGCSGATAAVRLHRARKRLIAAMTTRPARPMPSPMLTHP